MRGGGIWHVILLIFLASLVAGILQLGALLLLVGGLIFRPLQTMGVLIFVFSLDLIQRRPAIGLTMLLLLLSLNLLQRSRKHAKDGDCRILPPPHSDL